jgi:hypothetical protein
MLVVPLHYCTMRHGASVIGDEAQGVPDLATDAGSRQQLEEHQNQEDVRARAAEDQARNQDQANREGISPPMRSAGSEASGPGVAAVGGGARQVNDGLGSGRA